MGLWSSKFSHSTNDYELVIRSTKELEYILESQFGAVGRSVHEKLDALPEGTLSFELVRQMRSVSFATFHIAL